MLNQFEAKKSTNHSSHRSKSPSFITISRGNTSPFKSSVSSRTSYQSTASTLSLPNSRLKYLQNFPNYSTQSSGEFSLTSTTIDMETSGTSTSRTEAMPTQRSFLPYFNNNTYLCSDFDSDYKYTPKCRHDGLDPVLLEPYPLRRTQSDSALCDLRKKHEQDSNRPLRQSHY